MADPMAVLVGEHRVAEAGMPQGMAQEGQLAMVQAVQRLQPLLQGPPSLALRSK